MKYSPGLPQKNDNVSHNHPVKEFFTLSVGLSGIVLLVFWITGLFIDRAVEYITPQMEARIFSSLPVPVGEQIDPNDPVRLKLQQMVDQLDSCIDVGYPITVSLVKSESANAMAIPGGRMIVLSGLLKKVKSENGLMFILAHELAHYKNRDHLRGMGRGIVLTALAAFFTGSGSDLTQVLTPAVNLGTARYSQDRESLADGKALSALNCFYGHIGGADEFFTAMADLDESTIKRVTHYVATHPEAQQRINDLHKLAAQMRYTTGPVRPLFDLSR